MTKAIDYLASFFRNVYKITHTKDSCDLRKYSASIENSFESFLEEFPEFRLEIGKRGVILKNYGVANA